MKSSKFFKELYKIQGTFRDNSNLMGLYEGLVWNQFFNSNVTMPPFEDSFQWFFPVLEETPYSQGKMSRELAESFGKLIQIPEENENLYKEKIEYMLNLPLTRDMFKEHSLFLIQEHCKLFSPYCESTKKLLSKLQSLQ